MDIVEFAESFMNVKLSDWQKEHIRILEKIPRDAKIVMGPSGRVYIYMKENCDGYKNERQPAYHSGYKSRVYVDEEHHRSSSWS